MKNLLIILHLTFTFSSIEAQFSFPSLEKLFFIRNNKAYVYAENLNGDMQWFIQPIDGEVHNKIISEGVIVITTKAPRNQAYAFIPSEFKWIRQDFDGDLNQVVGSNGIIGVVGTMHVYYLYPENNQYKWDHRPLQGELVDLISTNGSIGIVMKSTPEIVYGFGPWNNTYKWLAPQPLQGNFQKLLSEKGHISVITSGHVYTLPYGKDTWTITAFQ